MIYQFRVTLPGLKGFYRIYKVNSANSLYHFHKQLQSDLAFPADQPILFKAYDADENVVARYALIDLGFGTVDDVTIEKALKDGAVKFDYYYDTQSKKRVILTLEGGDESVHLRAADLKGKVIGMFPGCDEVQALAPQVMDNVGSRPGPTQDIG